MRCTWTFVPTRTTAIATARKNLPRHAASIAIRWLFISNLCRRPCRRSWVTRHPPNTRRISGRVLNAAAASISSVPSGCLISSCRKFGVSPSSTKAAIAAVSIPRLTANARRCSARWPAAPSAISIPISRKVVARGWSFITIRCYVASLACRRGRRWPDATSMSIPLIL